jgi:hypothetical protein
MDISEFGLQAAAGPGMQFGPRFYTKYLEQVWFILFMPGKRDCISGYSHDIIERYDHHEEAKNKDNDDNDDEGEEKNDNDDGEGENDDEYARYEEEEKRIVAKTFDLMLTQEISKGAADFVDVTKKLCGWESTMLHDDLELARYFEAVGTRGLSGA